MTIKPSLKQTLILAVDAIKVVRLFFKTISNDLDLFCFILHTISLPLYPVYFYPFKHVARFP